jgi:hypothetical protein
MESDSNKTNKNGLEYISIVTNILKISDILIRKLFFWEVKKTNFFNKNQEVMNQIEDKSLNFNGTLDFNNMIVLYIKNKNKSLFIEKLEKDERKIFLKYLLEIKDLKNLLFHEQLFKLNNTSLKIILELLKNVGDFAEREFIGKNLMKNNHKKYIKDTIELLR